MNQPALLKIASFVSGFVIMSVETLAFRLLAPYFGSSVYVSGSLLGVVMCALAVGYQWGGKIADKYPSEKIIYGLIGLTSSWLLLLIIFQRVFFSLVADLGIMQGTLLSTFIVLGIPLLPLSMTSPYVIRILGQQKQLGSIAGTIYAISTFGSLAGVFITTFLLIPYWGVRPTLAINFIMLVLMFVTGLAFSNRKYWFGVFLIFLSLAPEVKSHDPALIEARESLYGLVQVRSPHPPILVMKINEGGGQSYYDPRKKFPYEYNFKGVFTVLPATFEPKPQKLLLLGMGGGTIASAWQSFIKFASIDIVEINHTVTDLAKQYFDFNPTENTKVHVIDARQFLLKSKDHYDFIALDTFQGFSTPYHLATEEFFAEIAKHLTPQGMLGINLYAPYNHVANRLCKTLHNVYSKVFILPGYLYGATLIASNGPWSVGEIQSRISKLEDKIYPEMQDPSQNLSKSINYLKNNLFECSSSESGVAFTDDLSDFDVLYFQSVQKTHEAEEDFSKSTELYNEGLRNWPNNPNSHFGIAENLVDQNLRSQAFEEINKVPDEKYSLDIFPITFMGEELIEKKQLIRAEKILASGLSLWSIHTDMQGVWGQLLFHKGQYNKSIHWLEKAAQSPKCRSKVFEYLGDAYAKTHEVEKAKKAYMKAVTVLENEKLTDKKIKLRQSNLPEILAKEKILKKA